MWVSYEDWKNISLISEDYQGLEDKYIDAFDEGIPLSIFSKDITMEQLRKEVEQSIKEGIDLYSKYRPEDSTEDNIDDTEYLNNIKLY